MKLKTDYDDLFKQFYNKYLEPIKSFKFSWRILKAIAFVESSLNPLARSLYAAGIMQFAPATFNEMMPHCSDEDIFDPKCNIEAGAKYIRWLWKIWKHIENPEDRIKFVLASYNWGIGHVIKVWRKHGKKSSFDEIASELPDETSNYITKVLNTYYMLENGEL